MNVSINTAVFLHNIEAGESQLDCLKKLTGSSIDNIEVRGEMFDDNTKDEELKRINLLCADNDWKFFYSVPEQLFNTDQVNANLKSYLEMAEKYHIDHLKISLGNMSQITENQLVDLKRLLDQHTVQVTIENQPNDDGIVDVVQKSLAKLKNYDIPLGYTYDAGNWYWIFETPTDAFNHVKNYISVFHLKDIKRKQTVMLDNGATDWRTIVKQLKDDTPIFLEYDIPDNLLQNQIDLVNELINDSVVEV